MFQKELAVFFGIERTLDLMLKHSFRFLLAASLLLVSSSLASADTYSIISNWHTGSAQFGSLTPFTGDGTFTWNGSSFSNIVFTFMNTKTNTVVWTATSTDGLITDSNKQLEIGNGTADCNGASCISVLFASAITTGSSLTLTGVNDGGVRTYTQDPNSFFDSATLTDTSFTSREGAVPEPGSVILILTVLGMVGLAMRRKLRPASSVNAS